MRFDWEHLKSWIFGLLGGSAAILLVVVAANSPTQSNSKPAGEPQSQSAAPATKAQTSTAPAAPQPVAPQTSSITDNAAKAPAPPKPVPVATTVEAAKEAAKEPAKPAPMKDRATVMAQAEPATPARAPPLPQKPQPVAAAAGLQGDADAGRQVFKKCQACHSLELGKTILGPSLAGIVGRKSAADANFSYSPAMKQAALTWDPPTLDAYLAEPAKIVPGNRMPFPGLKTDHDRQDVIAFLAAPATPAGAQPAAKAAAPSAPAAAFPQ